MWGYFRSRKFRADIVPFESQGDHFSINLGDVHFSGGGGANIFRGCSPAYGWVATQGNPTMRSFFTWVNGPALELIAGTHILASLKYVIVSEISCHQQ